MDISGCESLEEAKGADSFSLRDKCVFAYAVSVYDCDTFDIVFRVGGVPLRFTIRLQGVDGTELRNKDLKQKHLAYIARQRVVDLVVDKNLQYTLGDFDKYGRLLASVQLSDEIGTLSDVLCNEFLVQRYDGGTKTKWDVFMNNHWKDITDFDKSEWASMHIK